MSSVILPQFLYSLLGIKQNNDDLSDCAIKVAANSLQELFCFFSEKHPQIAKKIFTDDGMPHRNIILVLNEQIINHSDLHKTTFNEHSTLEVMFQFAGG